MDEDTEETTTEEETPETETDAEGEAGSYDVDESGNSRGSRMGPFKRSDDEAGGDYENVYGGRTGGYPMPPIEVRKRPMDIDVPKVVEFGTGLIGALAGLFNPAIGAGVAVGGKAIAEGLRAGGVGTPNQTTKLPAEINIPRATPHDYGADKQEKPVKRTEIIIPPGGPVAGSPDDAPPVPPLNAVDGDGSPVNTPAQTAPEHPAAGAAGGEVSSSRGPRWFGGLFGGGRG